MLDWLVHSEIFERGSATVEYTIRESTNRNKTDPRETYQIKATLNRRVAPDANVASTFLSVLRFCWRASSIVDCTRSIGLAPHCCRSTVNSTLSSLWMVR